MLEVNDKCKATDQFGNYYNEPVTVIGFEKNAFGADLVRVQVHEDNIDTVFYPNELRKE